MFGLESVIGAVTGKLGELVEGEEGGTPSFVAQERADRRTFAQSYKAAVGATGGGRGDTGAGDVNARRVAKLAIPVNHYIAGPRPPVFTVEEAAARYPHGINLDGSPKSSFDAVAGSVTETAKAAASSLTPLIPLALIGGVAWLLLRKRR